MSEILTEPRLDLDEETVTRAGDENYDGWFCISTNPYPCPASGCSFVARFQTAAHMVVVWPRADDPKLLATAENCRLVNRQPRIVEYEPGFGPSISYDRWVRLGRPVHGVAEAPDGYRERARDRL